jgi:lycopene cyclase domain-containing protein
VTYTALACAAVVVVVALDLAVRRSRLTLRREFWIAYGIVLFFQLLTNGWLTGREIVRYSAGTVLGGAGPRLFGAGRLVYAPVEDLLFGFALVLWTLLCWDVVGRLGSGTADQDRRARR